MSRAGVARFGRNFRGRQSLSIFAFTAALAFILGLMFAPQQVPAAYAAAAPPPKGQTLVVGAGFTHTVTRDGYSVTKKEGEKPGFAPPAFGVPDPGTAQAIGLELVHARGWSDAEFACLNSLFTRESHWNVYAANPSGAYGIPQALPGSKMASAGADWATNPATQITWGLNYIQGRYGTPCGAWAHSQSIGWY
jgi:hypothetical protein